MSATSTLCVGALLALPAAAAQLGVPASRVHPVTSSPKRVTIDFVTGKRIKAGGQILAANVQTIYNNTCSWVGGNSYVALEVCEDVYDEGRIPSLAPGAGSPVSLDAFTFGYCTYNAVAFQCSVAFADNAGGVCAGLTPPTPPPWSTSLVFTEINLSALGLPGSTAFGLQACWIVGMANLGQCIEADGDGVFNGSPAMDLFTWGFSHQMPAQTVGSDGFLVAGDPSVAAPGSCTYNIPCPPAGCGTGLDTQDTFWVNIDGTPVGSSIPSSCPSGFALNGQGTNCYFFGGWPGNPFASLYLSMEGGRTCTACAGALPYCLSSPTFDGCLPAMTSTGLPSLSNPQGHTVTLINAPRQQNSIQFVSLTGPNFVPFSNGWLCLAPPWIRLPIQNTGGVATCDGTTSYTLSEVQTSCANFGTPISLGSKVHQQAWIRDPLSSFMTAVSNGVTYMVCP